MKKKYSLYSFIGLLVFYFIFTTGRMFYFSHKIESNPKRYEWIFKDSVKKEIIDNACIGDVREKDTYYTYIYKNSIISILQLNELNTFNINDVSINYGVKLNDFMKDFSGEILNVDVVLLPDVLINFALPLEKKLVINLSDDSKVEKIIKGINYSGFIGKTYKISLNNLNGRNLILFDYNYIATQTLFLVCSFDGKFIIIIINSDDNFNEDIMGILNLSKPIHVLPYVGAN